MDSKAFYQSLSGLEKVYWHKMDTLFQKVNPQKPEKGIQALIVRARQIAKNQNISLESALREILAGATERTERRVQLLNQCGLTSEYSNPNQSHQ